MLADEGIELIGYRRLRDAMRSGGATPSRG
jgi:hypothetical protein